MDLDGVGQVDAGGNVERLPSAVDRRDGPGEGRRLIDLAGGVAEKSAGIDDVFRRRARVLLGPIHDQANGGNSLTSTMKYRG